MTAPENSKPSDRRKLRRVPAAEVSAEIHRKTGFLSAAWMPIGTIDFTRDGIGLVGDELALAPNEKVILRITLKLDMGVIVVDKVEGRVRNIQHKDGEKRYGVQFDYEANRHMKSLETRSRLGRIEGILDRSEQLQLRMAQQKNLAEDDATGYPVD